MSREQPKRMIVVSPSGEFLAAQHPNGVMYNPDELAAAEYQARKEGRLPEGTFAAVARNPEGLPEPSKKFPWLPGKKVQRRRRRKQ